MLVFGSTIHLLCTLDDSLDLNNGRSRQWSGGSENKVLSFNGFPSDPNKYVENAIILIPGQPIFALYFNAV
jgi:hypothetical protein